jgi:hypothetical protein
MRRDVQCHQLVRYPGKQPGENARGTTNLKCFRVAASGKYFDQPGAPSLLE